jgi:DNA-binding XRE family transcriptional regulator
MKLDAKQLINARHRRFLSQQEVADGAGVALQTVHNAENGKNLQPKKAEAICKFLRLGKEAVLSVGEDEDDAA